MAANLKVVTLLESNFRDPAASLRQIANSIDAGIYGSVGSVGIVLLGDKMEVFGVGEDAEAPAIALLLHAGFTRLSNAIEEYGR